jgi:seryl-tRNA synthetase
VRYLEKISLMEIVEDKTSASLLDELLKHGLLIATGVDGLYGRNDIYESVSDAIDRLITQLGRNEPVEVMRFPALMSRSYFEDSGYFKNFPHLAGTVHCFCGDESSHRRLIKCSEVGADWTREQKSTDVVLTPAACYPVYPTLAKRGLLDSAGALVDVRSDCFRREPSREPTRMQMFRMREYVKAGTAEQVITFREMWLDRAERLASSIGVPCAIEIANDPFFGRVGRVQADGQREQGLKFELLIPVNEGEASTACMSFNYHQDHFGKTWSLRLATGEIAHTACVAFGLERLTLSLFRHHGFVPAEWPEAVKRTLWA